MSEADLVSDIAGLRHSPAAFVRYCFPWGEGELSGATGPRAWQTSILDHIGERLRQGASAQDAIQIAVASGHGIGKSALVSWLILWAMSTHEDTRCVVTANTEAQLRTKTWPELAKWHRLAINKHWFTFTATALHAVDAAHEKTWRADAIPWSETRTEAFAGLHNQGRRLLVVFDEASAIPDSIWQVTEGALTDEGTEIIWAAFGNPTRNSGRFRACFGQLRHRWQCHQIDSRTVEGTNKTQIGKWIDDYGEDSDFVRVRVRGQFPSASPTQFIATALVDDARERDPISHITDPVLIGVDVAREGDDESVIAIRIGQDARSFPWRCLRVNDLMDLVGHVVSVCQDLQSRGLKVAQIAVDAHAMGAGVVDRLRQMGWPVMGAYNWPDAADPQYHNPNDRWWASIRDWLKVGSIPDDQVLADQLTGREMGFDARGRLSLEKKSDMKSRGLSSPDRADALALTFAFPVAPRTRDEDHAHEGRCVTEYDPLAV